jgi:hypothetical protein
MPLGFREAAAVMAAASRAATVAAIEATCMSPL